MSSSLNHVEAEYAKSGKSSCKKCSEPIENGALRLGMKDARGYTMWHHLACFSFESESVASVDKIEGFQSLKSNDQEALRDEFEKSKKEDSNGKKSLKNRKVREVKVDEDEDKNEGKRELRKSKGSSASSLTHVEAEYAKSSKSSCKKCSKPIEKKALRLGTKDARGYTMWHHLGCFSFESERVASVGKIEGFQFLKTSDQEALKNLVDEVEKPLSHHDSNGKKSSQKRKVHGVDEDETGERELNLKKGKV